jgi:hypothetical protein
MKHPTQKQSFAVMLTALLAALAAFVTTSQAQSLSQLTNGLVSYYPLDQLSPGTTNTTPDLISRRDLTMYVGNISTYMNGSAYIVAGSHPGMGDSTAVVNLNQSPATTLLVYQCSGQNPQNRSGDFLPFINQRGATMNFWIKAALPAGGNDARIFAECANNSDPNPFNSLGTVGNGTTGQGGILFFQRENAPGTDPNGVGVNALSDGTYQTPSFYYINAETAHFTTNLVFDNNWHMITWEIETNGDVHCFVDGNYDPGNQSTATTDSQGNPAVISPLSVTNTYYNTNAYPANGMTNGQSAGFYVNWVFPGLYESGAFDAFGGFCRNGTFGGGPPLQLSDVGFWNRTLGTNEVQWLRTNGISGVTLNTNILKIVNFSADFGEAAQNSSLNLHWNVLGANSTPGGITITGVGDVSSTPSGSAAIVVGKNATYSYTIHVHNGVVADQAQTITVKTFAGVTSGWNLVQRFDGLFGNTTTGVNGNGWTSLLGYYAGALDRFNVVTVNGNKVLSPKSGYQADTATSPIGYDTLGALSYGVLNDLTIPPFQKNTLFFRFTLATPPSVTNVNQVSIPFPNLYSGLDFSVGLTDFGFSTGPIGGTQPPGGGGTVGPGIHILQYDSNSQYQPAPYNLTADNYSGSNVINSYSYVADTTNGSASGLMTNVTYYCWLDVSNNNTMQNIIPGSPPVTNTINEPVYSLWIQKQGDPGRTQLFSNYGGDRSWANAGQNNDFPSANLNKVYVSVATENINASDNGTFFATTNNMIMVDDFYLSSPGYRSTVPRLFNITSVVRNPANAVVTWESLGSMLQLNTYTVQRTLSLNPASWTTLTNGLPSGGDFTSFTDSTIGSANTAFYRISWP